MGNSNLNEKTLEELISSISDIRNNNVKSKDLICGLKTGYKKLDEITNGLRKSDLIFIAGRPCIGKTSFALNLAYNMLSDNKRIVYFNLATNVNDLFERLLSIGSNVETNKINSCKLDDNEWDRMLNIAKDTESSKFMVIDDYKISLQSIIIKSRELKKEKDIDCIIIDYLQLLSYTSIDDEAKDHSLYSCMRSEEILQILISLKKTC